MTGLGLLLAGLSSQASAPDSLLRLAREMSPTALVLEVKARPLAVREAVAQAMTASVKMPDAGTDVLLQASRLSEAYAVAWADSFFVRELARFGGWPARTRAAKVRADSLRRAGIAAYTRAGPAAAMLIWRRALAGAAAIHDSAGMAGAFGNLAAGFLQLGRADSAATCLERARSLAAAIGDFRTEGNAVGLLAEVRRKRGDLDQARTQYARAALLRERVGDTRGAAADENNLGLLMQSMGDLDGAQRRFEAALASNRREGRDSIAGTNLVNLAGLASLSGDFGRADTLYRDALATWQAKGMWAEAAPAELGLGQLELRRGDYPAAQTALREALGLYARSGGGAGALTARRTLAEALAAAGDLQGALDLLRTCQRMADSTGAGPAVRAGIALARAELAVQLNTLAEAERRYGEAEQLFRAAGDRAGEADARRGHAGLLLAQQEPREAEALLTSSLRAQNAAGDGRAAALTRLALGEAAWQRGDTVAARERLARGARELARLGDPVASAAALGQRASLELEVGRAAVAESLYRAGLDRLKGRVAPEISWRLHAGLGLARRAHGGRGTPVDGAVRELRVAIAELERPSQSLVLPERRSAFLSDKWEAYSELALLEQERRHADAAFEASERLRAREMLEMLARGRVGARPGIPPELVAREQDLRRQVAELTGRLEGPPTRIESVRGPDLSVAPDATREALVRAQETYSEFLLELKERAPDHAALIAPLPTTWRDVARQLPPDAAMIEYLLGDSVTLAFVITRDTVSAVTLDLGRRELARLVEFARGTLGQHPERGDSLWQAPMRRLYQGLMAPLEEDGLLSGKRRLILIPDGELHYLPFAALLTSTRPAHFLVERYELAMAPSASVWLALGARAHAAGGAGVLAFAPRPEALPGSDREASAIGQRLGAETRVLRRLDASEAAFRRDAPGARVLHLATYGVLNQQNPLFSYVELAPGGGDDGRLEVHEVFGLNLVADLVVLSACQTGLASGRLADVPPGDDWMGLTRAFLHAGARHVVASLWAVEDLATAVLMERFYDDYGASGDPVRALAVAQRELLTASRTAHPFYWAGFTVAGGAPN